MWGHQQNRCCIFYFGHECFVLELSLSCRGGEARVLISTDVWARGLDVQQVGASITLLSPDC